MAVARTRTAAEAQLAAAKALPAAYLRAVFESPEAREWPKKRLDDICEKNISTLNPRLNYDDLFYYVDISSIDNNFKRIANPKLIAGKDAPSRARQVIHARDILVSTTRPNLNAVAKVPQELDNQICSTGFCVLRPSIELDSDFLLAFVQVECFVKNLSGLVNGALYPAVTDRQVRSQFIFLPTQSKQKAITEFIKSKFSSAFRLIATSEAQLTFVDKLPSTILRQAFNGEL